MKRYAFLLLVVACLATLAFSSAHATWNLNGNAVCPAAGQQYDPAIVSDGAGGAIVAWHENRNGNFDIFASRIGPTGITLWCGPVCAATGDQGNPAIVSDGAGGAIITWEDLRSGSSIDIYTQQVDSKGQTRWTNNGVAVCTAVGTQSHPAITSDGAGGGIIAWDDTRSGNEDIYAARFDYQGKRAWTLNGVALCTAANKQAYPAITSDGVGGAIVTWPDSRLGTLQIDIYARRINASGSALWTADGVGVCTAGGPQDSPVLVPDDGGGAIIAWQDRRSPNDDIYAQRINASGSAYWTANGVALCTAGFDQDLPAIVSDGASGAVVSWQDQRAGNFDIYARRVNAVGTALWTGNGVALCTAAQNQVDAAMATDGAGGAIVTWRDGRNGTDDIYAHHIDAAGNLLWMQGGSEVCLMNQEQLTPVIVAGSAGDAIVAWADQRSGTGQTYAQRLSAANGEWGNPEPTITSVVDVPNDQGRAVTVRWHEGDKTSVFYWYEVYRNDNGTWNYINTVGDNGGSNYSLTVPTLDDSTCWVPYGHQFQVRAWGELSWPDISNTVFASSHDNVAPPPPALTMQRVGGTVTLQWTPSNAPDFNMYSVYMSSIPGQPGTSYFDTAYNANYSTTFGPPFADQYWSVAVWDSHCNRSIPSNEVAFLLPNTPVGNNVTAAPYDDSGSGTHPASVTFSNVTTEGRTSLSITSTGQSLPGTFTAGDGKYYNVTTTATVNGNVEVCIQYDENALTVPEASIRLLHYDTALGLWQDITTIRDLVNNVICGTTSHLSPFVIGSWGVTAVGDDHPLKFALHDAVPNPFNPQTTIRYDVAAGGADVNITIYDVAGARVRELVNEYRAAGMWSVRWNGDDDRGQRVASGVYFYRMRAGSFVETRKMVLLK